MIKVTKSYNVLVYTDKGRINGKTSDSVMLFENIYLFCCYGFCALVP